MAMVRTIQHPGVQIQETEIGSYNSPVVMNNAYIMGYADRGPIYDYSWIMNTRDFTKIYGEPQNEAEKYLFTAVQSVLTNGGTPIVARMPYDNKQCKAYKAMKLKWADKTPGIDTDLADPIIPLSAVAGSINEQKSFKEIFTIESVTVNDQAVPSSFIEELTISQVVKQLNPYKSGSATSNGEVYDDLVYGLKINGVSPADLGVDQEAIAAVVSSLSTDKISLTKKVYAYNPGYDYINVASSEDIEKASFNGVEGEKADLYEVKDVYAKFYYTKEEIDLSKREDEDGYKTLVSTAICYINLFGDSKLDPTEEGNVVYLRDEIIPDEVVKSALKNSLNGSDLSALFTDTKTDTGKHLPGTYQFVTLSSVQQYKNLISTYGTYFKVEENCFGYYAPTSNYGGFGFEKVTKYYDKPIYGLKQSKEISSYISLLGEFDAKGNFELSPSAETLISDLLGTAITNYLDTDINGMIREIRRDPNGKLIDLDLIPIYNVPGIKNGLKGNGEACTSGTIIGYLNIDIESPAITGFYSDPKNDIEDKPVYSFPANAKDGKIKFSITPSGVTVNDESGSEDIVFDTNIKGKQAYSLVKLSTIKFRASGENQVKFYDYYKFTYTAQLNDIPIVDVDEDLMVKNPFLISLNTIYNSTKLLRKDERNIARLEAKLLVTPEMGFKYGLYLDGEDCEISNDQYDDLVTVNQFKAVDRTVDKYGHDIDDANFIIVDKQKTVAQGVGGNIGFFTVVIDPFDALKVQRLLVNPAEKIVSKRKITSENGSVTVEFDHSDSNINNLDYWAYEAADSWNQVYDELLDTMDALQRVRNADGIYVGEPNPIDGKLNILDSWAIPLVGDYYTESISKNIMRKFPGIPMADVNSDTLEDKNFVPSVIDHQYSTHVMVAVCKTAIDQGTGKITVTLVETFFGSLFNEVSLQNGRSLFIGDIINGNSDYIEFYRNNYVNAGEAGAYDPPEYRRTPVNQIFIKDSEDLKSAAQMRGIDPEEYALDALDPDVRAQAEKAYETDLKKKNIYVIDKKEVCIYNLHWEANFTSFSKKESQKIIANTSGLYSVNDGTTINIAKNFLIDMDRCINFIKNIDEIPIHFVCDAGLSTIAQFCDNVVWNPNKMTIVGEKVDPVTGKKTGVKEYVKTGGWITQPFNPDDDPDGEDRYITGYSDVATWRKVVEKLDSICSLIRKDCFAIIDAPRQLTLDGAAPKLRRTKFDNKFDKTIGRCLRYISGLNSSYCAGYYNWLRTTDQYTGRSIWIPPTSKIIGNYMYLNINNLPWLAPAGLTYGIITGCHAISHNPDYQEEDQIYMKSWNYIKQYPIEGFVVEGQKTMLGKESVFERINVRLLFLDLERFAYNVSRGFKYTVNNAYTREQFVATLKPKFEDYTLRGGIYEYLIKVDSENNTPETIDQNELRGDIFIKPARLIEYILLNFVGTSTGTNFNELPMG